MPNVATLATLRLEAVGRTVRIKLLTSGEREAALPAIGSSVVISGGFLNDGTYITTKVMREGGRLGIRLPIGTSNKRPTHFQFYPFLALAAATEGGEPFRITLTTPPRFQVRLTAPHPVPLVQVRPRIKRREVIAFTVGAALIGGLVLYRLKQS